MSDVQASARARGVLAPVVTPFAEGLKPDAARLARHCRWLVEQGVGLAVFGTNSEANSLSIDEKLELLDRLVGSGLDPARMMPGTGHCALPDSVRGTLLDRLTTDGRVAFVTFKPRPDRPAPLDVDVVAVALDGQA